MCKEKSVRGTEALTYALLDRELIYGMCSILDLI